MDERRKLVSMEKAREIFGGVGESTIRSYRDRGFIEGILVSSGRKRKYMYDQESLYRYKDIRDGKKYPFGDVDFLYGEVFCPLITIKAESLYAPFYYPQRKYVVTNFGNIWNFDNGRKVATGKTNTGYVIFSITFRGGKKILTLHRTVASMFCDNGRHLEYVHHIDCNKENNRADNLIWVTREEHMELLHPLWKSCKENGDFTEYDKEIQKIKEKNAVKTPYKFIVADKSENGISYLLVTEDAYKRVANGESIDHLKPEDILMETWLNIAQALKQECPV